MDLGIRNETALMVGASEGIGYESAKALLEECAEVVICSRSRSKLEAAARKLEATTGRTVPCFTADITVAAEVHARRLI
jgi:3-oxoacyl-[acyl-carrier protein] reductase